MIRKYIIPQCILLSLLITIQPIHVKAQDFLLEDETSIISNENLRFKAAQQADFDTIKQQTQEILASLQQLEQVLVAGKIKFDTTKVLKKELLQDINNIKMTIDNLYTIYTTEQDFSDGFITGILMNKMSIDYLLPCLENDISTISIDSFDNYMATHYPKLIEKINGNSNLLSKISNENQFN